MSEMAKSENTNEINENKPFGLASSSALSVNVSGTGGEIGTGLTQACSEPVLGYVYFVSAGDAIKIGYTKNAPSRLAALQTSNPEELHFIGAMRGTMQDEHDLHRDFCHLQIRGEWFRAEAELLEFITSALADDAWERSRPAPSKETLVIIKGLKAKREACGADTPTGHRYSNLMEHVRNIERATGDQVKYLQTFMARTAAEIERLTA